MDDAKKKLRETEDRESNWKTLIGKLEQAEGSLKEALSCPYCKGLYKNSVTCIPCGHSFCFKCKDAYANKRCHECNEDNSIEVVYRNKLLDEFVAKHMLKLEIFELLKGKR